MNITAQQSQLLSRALSAMTQLEMLQIMVKKSDDTLNAYSIQDYAFLLDEAISEACRSLCEFQDSIDG